MTDDKDEIAKLEARLAELRAKAEAEASKVPPDAIKVETEATTGEPWSPTFAKPKAKPKSDAVVIGAGVVIAIVLVLIGISMSKPTPNYQLAIDETANSTAALKAATEEAAPVEPVSPWSYTSEPDPMTDRKTETACVTSTNQVIQDSPYDITTARLCIRQSPQYGLDVIVALNAQGQILCRSYDNCSFKVRFDEKAQQSFGGADSADGSSNVVFIRNAERFVTSAKTADVTRVEIQIYQAGNQVLEFPTKGLEWPRPAS